MALTITELNAVTKKYFDDKLNQQVYGEGAFLALLKSRKQIKTDGGSQIQFPIRYAKYGMADATDPRAQVVFQTKQTRTAGVVDWAYYQVQTTLHWDEQSKNSGQGRIINLMQDKLTEAKEDMFDVMSTALHATSKATTNDLDPLIVPVDSATDYAGIAVADAAAWAAQEDSSATTLALYGSASVSYYVNACTLGKNQPTHFITTRNLASKFESLVEPQKRYEDEELADLGFKTTTFHGKPIIADSYCQSTYLYGLDLSSWELRVHPDYNMTTGDGWFSLKQGGYPQAVARVMAWQGQLVCKCRKTNFKMTALVYSN